MCVLVAGNSIYQECCFTHTHTTQHKKVKHWADP
jgi:hypothetical protein